MEKLIRVLEGITATLWAITILYSIFFFLLGGFLLNDIFQEILISLITGAISKTSVLMVCILWTMVRECQIQKIHIPMEKQVFILEVHRIHSGSQVWESYI